jgi:hypothetical protein
MSGMGPSPVRRPGVALTHMKHPILDRRQPAPAGQRLGFQYMASEWRGARESVDIRGALTEVIV